MKKNINKALDLIHQHDMLFLTIMTIIYELLIQFLSPYMNNISLFLTCIFVISSVLVFFDKNNPSKNMFYVIYLIGVIIRTIYILNTDLYTRQHDVGTIDDCGHLGYIYTLYFTHKLPLTNTWQFYHPPCWHILAAFWLMIIRCFQTNIFMALEGIQILTLVFSTLSIVIVNKICSELKMKEIYRYLTISFFAVHPTMIILSGSINNDMLMIFLELLIILKLIDWYNDASIKNTIVLAIITGLCVMTKLNGAIMAVPILYVFLLKLKDILHHNSNQVKQFFIEMLLFGIISLPLGLWFPIYSFLKFGGYNVVLGLDGYLYVGDYSIFSRFFSLNIHQLFDFPNVYFDYNLPAYIIKSSLFGEFIFENIGKLNIILIIVNFILIVISLLIMLKYMLNKRIKHNLILNILLITYITSIISMYIFNFNYPNGCSMDFRYIVITLVPGIVFITYYLSETNNRLLKKIVMTISCLFIVLAMIFELMI